MSGIPKTADMQDRLVIIEHKLDAIIDFLGIAREWPGHASQVTNAGAISDALPIGGGEDRYMVFRNFTFDHHAESGPHRIGHGSDGYRNVDYTPRPHSAAAIHDYTPIPNSPARPHPRMDDSVPRKNEQLNDGYAILSKDGSTSSRRRITSNSSSGDFFEFTDSIASSARSSRDDFRDALPPKTGAVSMVKCHRDAQPVKEATQVLGMAMAAGPVNNADGGRTSRSEMFGEYKAPEREMKDDKNKSQQSWNDSTKLPVDHRNVPAPLSDRGASLSPKHTERAKLKHSRAKTSRSYIGPSSNGMPDGNKTKRDLLRSSSARDNFSSKSVRHATASSTKKQEVCSNAEVVRQIKEKIMEIRHRDTGGETKPREVPPAVPRGQRVDRSSLKYYGRVDMGQKEEPKWFSDAWEDMAGGEAWLVDSPELEEVFPLPPGF